MVHLRSVLAIARKDALDILLDKAKIAALAAPIALTLLWLLISKVIVAHPTTLLVYNPGQSRLEQVVSSAFSSTQITQASSPDQVSAAFGPNGASKKTSYDVGLVIPADFEQSVRAGGPPQVSLYLNGSNISPQQGTLLQAAIVSYARAVATPAPPVDLAVATINPASKAAAVLTLSTFYSQVAFALSFFVSLTLLPGLLIEEKEKKTLRMLMVSPASFGDVLLGKVLVVFVYQLALSSVMMGVLGGFSGDVQLVLTYMLAGTCLALAVGLLVGSLLQTAGAAGGVETLAIFAFIIPAVFIPLTPYISGNPIAQIIKVLPSYYLADGVHNAMQNQGTFNGNVIDLSVTLGCAVLLFLVTVWVIRRQSAVLATI